MTRRPCIAVAAALALSACAAPASSGVAQAAAPSPSATHTAPRPHGPEQAAAASITPAEFYEHIAFLASDAMRGRNTPSPELNAAAAYLVERYRELGLRPGGGDTTFYQWFMVGNGRRRARAPNVIAVLPGSDPALRDEYVVLSAHLDHVGVGRPQGGDSIYNGADDDASGTTALLEVAEALAGMAERPRRSVVFLHVSGEELGLLGSQHFTENPTIPLDRIVANVNVDMIGRNAADRVVVIGKDYSSLGEVVDRAASTHPELGLEAVDDPWPEEQFFFRSDHFNFARREIPAIFFFSGVHADYHQPSDEVELIDTDKAARIARLVFFTVLEVATVDGRPRWDPDALKQVRAMVR